jgi:hypothetical protein
MFLVFSTVTGKLAHTFPTKNLAKTFCLLHPSLLLDYVDANDEFEEMVLFGTLDGIFDGSPSPIIDDGV